MRSILWLIDNIITIYVYLLIASAVLSWLVAFNVVNVRNPIVSQIGEFLFRVTEPRCGRSGASCRTSAASTSRRSSWSSACSSCAT